MKRDECATRGVCWKNMDRCAAKPTDLWKLIPRDNAGRKFISINLTLEQPMDMVEWLRALLPALIAGVPVMVFAFQLRQQNRLERKKIEVEYLRRALEVLDVPFKLVLRLNARTQILSAYRQRGEVAEYESHIIAAGSEWEEGLDRYMSAMFVAMSFARESGRDRLRSALNRAFDTANDLRFDVLDVLRRVETDAPAKADPGVVTERFARAVEGRNEAANALVVRIHELYG